MANRRMEFMIGMTVLVVFATIVIMAVLFGSNRTSIFQFKQGQKMSILFDRAPGIKNTSRVTKSGVEIGRVVRTQLVDDGPTSHVLVNFTIDDPNVHIYSNEQARIKPSLLMGEAEIEFVKNPDYTGTVHEIGPDEPITGNLGGDILGTVSNIEDNMKSAITRCVGIDKTVDPDIFSYRIRPGSCAVLCSDGLTNHVEPSEIRVIVNEIGNSVDIQGACETLIDCANDRGGLDNITAVILSV